MPRYKKIKETWKEVREWYAEFKCPYCSEVITDYDLYDIAEIDICEEYNGNIQCCFCKKIFQLELS